MEPLGRPSNTTKHAKERERSTTKPIYTQSSLNARAETCEGSLRSSTFVRVPSPLFGVRVWNQRVQGCYLESYRSTDGGPDSNPYVPTLKYLQNTNRRADG